MMVYAIGAGVIIRSSRESIGSVQLFSMWKFDSLFAALEYI